MEPAMGGMIELSEHQWEKLRLRLIEEYQHEPSVMLIRTKMRQVLGFTPRHHQSWPRDQVTMYPERRVCLDFFDDRLETWFRLKYAEYL